MPLDLARPPDPGPSAGMARNDTAWLAIPGGRRRIAGPEPSDASDGSELRHFLVAMSAILGLVLLTGARLLAAV